MNAAGRLANRQAMIADVYTLLTRDHARLMHLLDAVQEADDARRRGRSFARFVEELRLHARIEEDVLYQPLRKAFPAEVERGAAQRRRMDDLIDACRIADDDCVFADLFEELRAAVVRHVVDEEESFFLQARRLIPDGWTEGSEYRRLRRALEAGGGAAASP